MKPTSDVAMVDDDPPLVDLSDGELIAGSVTSPELFGHLFDRHGAAILRFLTRRVPGGAAPEDLLGETFLVAFGVRTKYDTSVEFARPWLMGIASNVVHRSIRDEAKYWRNLAKASDHVALHADSFEDDVARRVDADRADRRWRRLSFE